MVASVVSRCQGHGDGAEGETAAVRCERSEGLAYHLPFEFELSHEVLSLLLALRGLQVLEETLATLLHGVFGLLKAFEEGVDG